MMSRRVLLLALFVLPVTAQAQRGGGGGGAPPVNSGERVGRGEQRANYRIDAGGGNFTISNKDVESLSPVYVFLDKKKALSLTDDQVKQLKAMDAALDTQNDTLYHQLDSLRKEMRVNNNAANPQVEQMRVRGVRTAMVAVIKSIRESYDKIEPQALGVLTEPQQKAGSELLDKHQEEVEKMLQEKLGGRKPGS
jgi:hypothetical protein